MEKELLTRAEFFDFLRVGEWKGKQILAEHPELAVRIGDRVLIPVEHARAFVAGLVAEQREGVA